MVRDAVSLPLLAAGGIADGRAILAAEALGADGVQIGSRFAVSVESSAHENFKKRVIESGEGDTVLTLKRLTPVRLIKNEFFNKVNEAEVRGATTEELAALLGKRRAKQGIFEGDLEEGELEIGQVSAMIRQIQPAQQIFSELWNEYLEAKRRICQ